MVDQLLHLVSNYSLDEAQDPVDALDKAYPKWRAGFPLPLDEDTGTGLLNSLLTTASDERKKRRVSLGKFSCTHFWQKDIPEKLRARITLPKKVSFQLDEPPSTTRFDLVVVQEDKIARELGPGYARVEGINANVDLRLREVIAFHEVPAIPLRLAAMVGGVIISSIAIPGSDVALGDVPVGFMPDDDNWLFVGQASFNTASREVLLILPKGSNWEADDPTLVAPETEGPIPSGLPAIRINGAADVRVHADESFRVRTGRDGQQSSGVALSGTPTGWPTNPAATYVGLPRAGTPEAVSSESDVIDLFVSGHAPGSSHPQDMFGAQFVSVRNRNGDSLLRRKIGILPPDFSLSIISGSDPGMGSIQASTRTQCLLQVASCEGLKTKQIRGDDKVELQLQATSGIPARVTLSVTPNLEAGPIHIYLPFPGFGCMAFDRDGASLPDALSIDDLLGARLHLLGKGGRTTEFDVELSLRGQNARKVHYRWSHRVSGRPVQVELFNLRDRIIDLLSLKQGIDQTVRLQVFMDGRTLVAHDIRRYKFATNFNANEGIFEVSQAAAGVEPVMMALPDPKRRPDPLTERLSEGVATGTFDLPNTHGRSGPWLIFPSQTSECSFRPCVVPDDRQAMDDKPPPETMEEAAANVNFKLPDRGFGPVFDAMASNLRHSGWDFLKAHLEHYSHLSLAAFESWKALVGHHPRALAVSLFKFEMDPAYMGRIEHEFPFLWELFPAIHVLDAANTFRSFLVDVGLSDDAVLPHVDHMLDRFTTVAPAYAASVHEMYHRRQPIPPSAILGTWYTELLRDRSEATWPDFGSRRLAEWHQHFEPKILNIEPAHAHHRAVMYCPVFAAAVAADKVTVEQVFVDKPEAIFLLRRIRDFDTRWFEAVYRFSLAALCSQGE